MADWRTDVIKAVGGKPSPGTLAFLQGWGLKEGGHEHNTARFNWLNRKDAAYPRASSTQQRIAAYPDYQTGVARTAGLIQEGYPAIYNALRSGQVSFQNPNVQGDLNRWLTGKRTPGMSPYVSNVAQLSGLPAGAGAATPPSAAAPPVGAKPPVAQQQQTEFAPTLQNVMGLVGSLRERREARREDRRPPSLGGLVGQIMAMRQPVAQSPVADRPAERPQSGPVAATTPKGATNPGQMFVIPTSQNIQGTHVTDGWGSGGKTAHDFMQAPGTPVGAPEDGVVEYFHPTGAQGGGSMLIRTASGRQYWVGHIADGVQAGTRVRRGQQIATVSADHANPHVHVDYT